LPAASPPPSDGGAGNARNLDLIAEATDPENLLLFANGKGNRDQLGLAS
jgi:hypothetical protein